MVRREMCKYLVSLVRAAGFRTFRRAAETPFNLVYEADPDRDAIGRRTTGGWTAV